MFELFLETPDPGDSNLRFTFFHNTTLSNYRMDGDISVSYNHRCRGRPCGKA